MVHSTCGLFKLWVICTVHDRRNYWVVASTINSDCSVQNYDSVYSTVNVKTIDIINNIFVITDKTKVDLKRMQIQKGLQVFAIAIATALLYLH